MEQKNNARTGCLNCAGLTVFNALVVAIELIARFNKGKFTNAISAIIKLP